MKTPEQWISEFECGFGVELEGLAAVSPVEILEVQRDAYRQGLVDAAKAECPGCRKSAPVRASSGLWLHGERRAFCYAPDTWKLIAAHDKEQAND